MLGQQTTTSPYGREFSQDGYPIKMTEMLSQLEGVGYAARVAADTPKRLTQAKKSIFKAFESQVDQMGMGFVEILSSCPTNWGMSPLESNERIEKEMIPYFPLGIFKERKGTDFM